MARKYTDAELIAHEFFMTKPYNQQRLVETLAPGETIVDVVNIYAYEDYPAKKARCIHCHRAGHRDGFTAKTSLNNHCLLGSHCGEAAAGTTWHELSKDFEARRDRQHYLRFFELSRKGLPGILRPLAAWRPQIDRLNAAHRRFISELPEVHGTLLHRYSDGDTRLTIVETRRIERPASSDVPGVRGSRQSQFIDHVVFAHRLQGIAFFALSKPLDKYDKARRALSEAAEFTSQTPNPTLADMKALTRRVKEAVKVLSTLADAQAAIPMFFSPDNLAGLAEWLRRQWKSQGGYYWADGGVLHLSSKEGQRSKHRMSSPGEFAPLDRSPVEAIERLITSAGGARVRLVD
jgi:hypothetical protein